MPERINSGDIFDLLGDILNTLRFRGSIFFQSDLAAPWGIALPHANIPRFHLVISGQCYVGTDTHESVRASESDIIMLPNGSPHWIADRPGRELIASERAGEACELGNPLFQNGKITNRLLCGLVQFDEGHSHPIVDALPQVLHFPGIMSAGSTGSVVKLIDDEMRRRGGRRSLISDRLTEVLFLRLLEHFVAHDQSATGFLAAFRDQRVFKALRLIHQEPDFDWTLASLGLRSGMSRATLVRRFQEVVGMPPMAYVIDWRIMKARRLVASSAMALEQIAEHTGFASARTLSRTFKRFYGCTPSEFRRQDGGTQDSGT